jgi:hypothetical protein
MPARAINETIDMEKQTLKRIARGKGSITAYVCTCGYTTAYQANENSVNAAFAQHLSQEHPGNYN